jgi:transposase
MHRRQEEARQQLLVDELEALSDSLGKTWTLSPDFKAKYLPGADELELVRSGLDDTMRTAYQAMRGVSILVAATFAVEVGDVRRFDNPRQLMAFLGLVPSERSTGDSVKRGGLTRAGNRRARRVLVEGAWSYRHPARVTERIRQRLDGLPKAVRDIAWKAQVRLSKRYRLMTTSGKKAQIVIAAIAREMAAFLWAIGREVEPRQAA